MGNEHDPYNQTPKLDPDSDDYKEYMAIANRIADELLSHAHVEEKHGWQGGYVKDGITIHTNQTSDIMSFRGYGEIHRCSPEILRLFIVQIDQRSYWDPTFLQGTYNVEVSPAVRIMTHSYDAPFPVSPRDFVTIGAERLEEDGTLIAGVQSIVREDLPERRGYVRGELRSSGFVIKPIPPEPGIDYPRCAVYYLATVDVKGWLPTWVVNLVNAQQPLNINALRDLISKVSQLIQNLLLGFHDTADSAWKAPTLQTLVHKVVKDAKFESKMTAITDPLRYFLLERRVGPTDEEVFLHMETRGKHPTMARLCERFQPYVEAAGTDPRMQQLQIYTL